MVSQLSVTSDATHNSWPHVVICSSSVCWRPSSNPTSLLFLLYVNDFQPLCLPEKLTFSLMTYHCLFPILILRSFVLIYNEQQIMHQNGLPLGWSALISTKLQLLSSELQRCLMLRSPSLRRRTSSATVSPSSLGSGPR